MDLGQMGGLAEFGKGFLQTYMMERARRDEQKQNALAKALQAKVSGYQMNQAGDDWQMTPEKIAQAEMEKRHKEAQIGELERRHLDQQLDRDYKRAQIGKIRAEIAQGKPTEAEKTIDKEFGKEYADFELAGGYAGIEKNLGQLEDVKSNLKNKNVSGRLMGLLPDAIAPEAAISSREKVQSVIQNTLRPILGAQFTEKEAEHMMKRAYNPRLSEEENLQRVEAIEGELRERALAKEEAGKYFRGNRTVRGYEPRREGVADKKTKPETKTVGGILYKKVAGGWEEVGPLEVAGK